MTHITLTNSDLEVFVETEIHKLIQAHWMADRLRLHSTGKVFAQRKVNKKQETIYLHRWIAEQSQVKKPTDLTCRPVLTFRDGNPMNLHSDNLIWTPFAPRRAATGKTQNKNGFTGVVFLKKAKRYQAEFSHKGDRHKGPRRSTPKLAAQDYNDLATKFLGDTATLNTI